MLFDILMLNNAQLRADLRYAVLDAIDKCSEIQCASDILKEVSQYTMTPFSFRKAMIDGVRDHRQQLRDKIFAAMLECITAWSNLFENCAKQTQRLMEAINEFYHPFPGEEFQFDLETATDFERETSSAFVNAIEYDLPITFDCRFDNFNICQLRRFADGLSALRIELLPQLAGVIHHNLQNKLLSIGDYEDRIRERLFFRVHARTVADNDDDFPVSTCMNCTTSAQYWDRDMQGRQICADCHLRMRQMMTTENRRFRPVEKCTLTGRLRYLLVRHCNLRNDLTEQLRSEYSLTD